MRTTAVLLVVSLVAGVACAQTSQPSAKKANEDVIAIVLGKELTVKDKDNLDGLIFGLLLEKFTKDNKIEPTAEELDASVQWLERLDKQWQMEMKEERLTLIRELEGALLSDQEREQKRSRLAALDDSLKSKKQTRDKEEQTRSSRRSVALRFVGRWKVNKALYEKYGGRVIFQQAGPEPLDAYRDFLKEHEKKGAFKILDKQYEARFWRYFTNEAMHSFYSKDEGEKFINTPLWMMDPPSAGQEKTAEPRSAGDVDADQSS